MTLDGGAHSADSAGDVFRIATNASFLLSQSTTVRNFETFDNLGTLRESTLNMGDGGQTFINRGTIAADTTINMGGGDDTFQVEGSSATFTGTVTLDGGAHSADSDGDVFRIATDASFLLSQSTTVRNFETFDNLGTLRDGTLNMGDGGQTFINRGTIAADTTINMGGGDDTFQVEGSSATFTGTVTLNGGAHSADSAGDVFRIATDASFLLSESITIRNFETFDNLGTLRGGTLNTGDGGQTFINRGTIAADTTINMGAGDDTFLEESSNTLNGILNMGAGMDTLTVRGQIGNPDSREETFVIPTIINMGEGADTVNIETGSRLFAVIDGGTGDDRVNIRGGTLSGVIDSNTDDDTLTITGAPEFIDITILGFEVQPSSLTDVLTDITIRNFIARDDQGNIQSVQVLNQRSCSRLSSNNQRLCEGLFKSLPSSGDESALSARERAWKDGVVEVNEDYILRQEEDARFDGRISPEWSNAAIDTGMFLVDHTRRQTQDRIFGSILSHQVQEDENIQLWSSFSRSNLDVRDVNLPYESQMTAGLLGINFYPEGQNIGVGAVVGRTNTDIEYDDVSFSTSVSSDLFGLSFMVYNQKQWSMTFGGGFGNMDISGNLRNGSLNVDGDYSYIYGEMMMNYEIRDGWWLTPSGVLQYSRVSLEGF